MSSWKKFGGINNLEKSNNITTNSLSADYFTLNNAYVGYFSICGELSVSQNTHLNADVFIDGNTDIKKIQPFMETLISQKI